jgi:hypothetical protein
MVASVDISRSTIYSSPIVGFIGLDFIGWRLAQPLSNANTGGYLPLPIGMQRGVP